MPDFIQASVTDTPELIGTRLDKVLTILLQDFSRSRVQSLLSAGQVHFQDGTAITDSAYRVRTGDIFEVVIPPAEDPIPKPENIPLEIVYEDQDLLVINKEVGMVVHPAAGVRTGTLVNAVLYHCKGELSGIGGVKRPGIVHRLDKDTSGLIIVAKNDLAHHSLSAQLAARTLKRTYNALVWGIPPKKNGQLTGNIGRHPVHRKKMSVLKRGGKVAITDYEVMDVFRITNHPLASLVKCRLQTGRTHQIRVHFLHFGHALIGDQTYGSSLKIPGTSPEKYSFLNTLKRQALHAVELTFIHPVSSKKITVSSPLPEEIKKITQLLLESC